MRVGPLIIARRYTYAAAADHAAELKLQAAEVTASIERCAREQRYFGDEGQRHWRAIGVLGRVLHRSGVHADPLMEAYEAGQRRSAAEIAALRPHQAALARQLPEAEKEAAAALARAQPQAAAELARRQERAGLARHVLDERHEQERVQRRAQGYERRQGREFGLGR